MEVWESLRRFSRVNPRQARDFARAMGVIGNLTGNAHIGAFNSRPRQKCINAFWIPSLSEARARIEEWRVDYN